ncbi:hypothetical protein JXA40_00250 [bacterium]|nr:hypothetical protein [candidate division CSSED10-310 bacterium]
MRSKLNLLILWHMHQPAYSSAKDPTRFRLPWTRLHATKDYLGMARIIAKINGVRTNFNFTPALWEQLRSYAQNAEDRELQLSRIPVDNLTENQKTSLLETIFTGNFHTMIHPHPRYREVHRIYQRRGYLSNAELRDAIVLRILAWIHPETLQDDPHLSAMMRKASGFTESDKSEVIDRSIRLISRIQPEYRRLIESGKAEITVSPYYHPILPLLLNTDCARTADPSLVLPEKATFPVDARWHVSEAIEYHRNLFGDMPNGMWPSEGAVSIDTMALIRECNIQWVLTDEDILARSLGVSFQRKAHILNHPELLYRPWRLDTGNASIILLFRDHFLSDLIGFEYQHWEPEKAVRDFLKRLTEIRSLLGDSPEECCVTIVLDGENAWEHYHEGGWRFLELLFRTLTESEQIELHKITPFLDLIGPDMNRLTSLSPGTWINGNFNIWIGHPEKNIGWECLRQASISLEAERSNLSDTDYAYCKRLLRIAQGSDWFWWFGDDHHALEKPAFDLLFRENLQEIYLRIAHQIPDVLLSPILKIHSLAQDVQYPRTMIHPKIDGRIGSYFDWWGSGHVESKIQFSSVHKSDVFEIPELSFGFDLKTIYFLLRLTSDLKITMFPDFRFRILLLVNSVPFYFNFFPVTSETKDHEIIFSRKLKITCSKGKSVNTVQAVMDETIEISIPFKTINANVSDRLEFFIEVYGRDSLPVRFPGSGMILIHVPDESFEDQMWHL